MCDDRQRRRSAVRGNGWISEVDVAHKLEKSTSTLPAQSVIAALGFTADLGPLTEWGLEIDSRHIVVNTRMETAVPRVYAAGDITDYPGKVRLIAVVRRGRDRGQQRGRGDRSRRGDLPRHSTEQEG